MIGLAASAGAIGAALVVMAAPEPAERGYAGPQAVPAEAEAVLSEAVAGGAVPVASDDAGLGEADAPGEASPDQPVREVRVRPRRPRLTEEDRSGSVVTRREIEEMLPRSAPDALRNEPGVYVQQTAHAQASPYVRGLTGQRTVMYFDGVRLNNSTFRKGPNQYFFTIDSRTIQRLEVMRGSASTRYGSDAIGAALLSWPIEPSLERGPKPVVVHGRAMGTTATADASLGGRAQTDVGYKGKLGFLGGVGYRKLGLLRSGGRIEQPATGEPQNAPPLFLADGKTQRGTGFRELTADGRVVWQPRRKYRFTLGYYDYRQFDAPRTDKCPPPTAPEDECLRYNEQFRTLAYGGFASESGPAAAESTHLRISYQRQHEDRTLDRGQSPTVLDGQDNVHTVGTRLQLRTKKFALAPWVTLNVLYGADAYYDHIVSHAEQRFEDVGITTDDPFTQYADGSRYLTSGVWAEVATVFAGVVRLRAGGRGALVLAKADEIPARDSAGIDRLWATAVGNTGISWQVVPWLQLLFNVDQGFRAPNLDDLTSRQQTGPGFQFENPDLLPERSVSLEAGFKIRHPVVEVDAWAFQTYGYDFMERAARTVEDCPMGDDGCGASQTRFQLVNLDGRSILRGAEGDLRLFLPADLLFRANVSYAWGEGPNPAFVESPDQPRRVPLSRIPPLHGIVDFGWRSSQWGVYAFATMRWATLQDRLAPQDANPDDPRIPNGGTPGYVVVDVRAGYRLDPWLLFGLVFENVADTAYRVHGSSVNGPGRGLIAHVEFGF